MSDQQQDEELIRSVISEYSAQGDHRTGSDVDLISATWLAAEVGKLGASATLESSDFKRLVVGTSQLEVAELVIPGVPLYDCTYTGEQGVVGTLGLAGGPAEIALMVSSPHGGGTSAIEGARHNPDYRGLLIVTDPLMPAGGPAVLNAEAFTSPYGQPVLQIDSQHLERLKQLAGQDTHCRLILEAKYEDATATNVTLEIKGRRPDLPPLVVMTPRSGWYSCASERGGGLACWLALIHHIQLMEADRTVIFTANTGHELGHIGLDDYLSKRPGLINEAWLWIHLGANFAARDCNVRLQHSDENLRERMSSILLERNLVAAETLPGQRPAGEARNIYDDGGRYISILGSNPLFHHPSDGYPEAVDLEMTQRWCAAMIDLVTGLLK